MRIFYLRLVHLLRCLHLKPNRVLTLLAVALLLPVGAMAQGTNAAAIKDPVQELLLDLRDELRRTRADLVTAQQSIEQLHGELNGLRSELARRIREEQRSSVEPSYMVPADVANSRTPESAPVLLSAAELNEQQKLVQAQLQELQQTKVESGSKYRVKLSGLLLMNVFSNRGAVNNTDLPTRALNAKESGSIGLTLRQSIFGLNVAGPVVAGARTSGTISADFFGGVPQQPFGATAGILRLREASAHFDWRNTSLTFGQEAPFIAPLSPTSFATVAEPAMSWSGNLWVWTPQVFAEQRFLHRSRDSFFSFAAGVMAPLTEDVPDYAQTIPGPGERTRRPAFASRITWQAQVFGRTLLLGFGGYTSHLQYQFGHKTDAWAMTSFWQLPLGSRLQLSGEAYRGRALGGLGGGIWQTVLYDGDPGLRTTNFRPLNAAGGWLQLKARLHPRWETNAAFGQDNVLARDLRWTPRLQGEYMTPLARNRTVFSNIIYQPRSNLLLSAEFRRIWTYGYIGPVNTADQVNLGAGVRF
jgi:hypothetical protein